MSSHGERLTALRSRQHASLGYLLIRAGQHWNERALADLGQDRPLARLREAHTRLIPLLMSPEGIRLTTLAEQLGVTKQAVQPLILDLVELGLVTTRKDPSDKRARRLVLSERGLRIADQGTQILEKMEGDVQKRLGAKKTRELKSLMQELAKHVF